MATSNSLTSRSILAGVRYSFFLFGICISILAQEVTAVGGNILFTDKTGVRHQVTASGRDEDPSLSPDGSLIVFLRKGVEVLDKHTDDGKTILARQIWIVGLRTPPRQILGGPTRLDNEEFYAPFSPKLSPTNNRIYYLVHYAATTQAIVALEVETAKVRYIASAMDFSIIPSGKYSGFLIALEHRPKLVAGYYDMFFLLNPDGNELGVIGTDQRDIDLFLERYRSR